MPKQHIVIVAGEESGDRHAADLVNQLNVSHPHLYFTGIGGRHMQNAGVELLSDLARFGVTGLTEVLRYFPIIRRAFKSIQTHLIQHKPDLLILIDYPGFNLRLAQFAKKNNIRVLYYIGPQIWAWKAHRIHIIHQCVDRMAVILPFEKAIYEKAGVPVSFVGHPLVKDVKMCPHPEELRQALGLPTKKRLIALLPGSRTHEIERHMPVLVATIQQLLLRHSDLHFVIPVAGTIQPERITHYFKPWNLPITLVDGRAVEVSSCADYVIVASGTASLECALLEKPMCIIYKGSFLSYIVACSVIKIQYLGLCNILQNRMIVPELLQYDCNAEALTQLVDGMLKDTTRSTRLSENLRCLKQSLSAEQADCTMGELVIQELKLAAKSKGVNV